MTIIQTSVDKIYLSLTNGKNLAQIGANGINGTFFDMRNPSSPNACWGVAINKGKPIGGNAMINHPNPHIKRATVIYGENRISTEYVNNINEVERKVDWAIGGVGLYPVYDPRYERVPKDILRTCRHTGLAFSGDTVYLIACSRYMSLYQFKQAILQTLKVDGAIALDGGGSTQLFYNKALIYSKRKLNNMIGVMK